MGKVQTSTLCAFKTVLAWRHSRTSAPTVLCVICTCKTVCRKLLYPGFEGYAFGTEEVSYSLLTRNCFSCSFSIRRHICARARRRFTPAKCQDAYSATLVRTPWLGTSGEHTASRQKHHGFVPLPKMETKTFRMRGLAHSDRLNTFSEDMNVS